LAASDLRRRTSPAAREAITSNRVLIGAAAGLFVVMLQIIVQWRRIVAKFGPYSLRSEPTRVFPCFRPIRPLLSR
jgi:hypothetical protein